MFNTALKTDTKASFTLFQIFEKIAPPPRHIPMIPSNTESAVSKIVKNTPLITLKIEKNIVLKTLNVAITVFFIASKTLLTTPQTEVPIVLMILPHGK
jgi:hypothetical protein